MKTLPRKYHFAILAAFILPWIFTPQLYASDGELTFEVSPQKVEINSFYHGATLTLKGTAPAHSELAMVWLGEEKTHTLQRKDRVGPLWMNVDTITIEGAPEMYYLATSTKTQEELASFDVLAGYSIGYNALRESVTIEQANSPSSDSLFPEFIRLKEHMELYRMFPHSITTEPASENMVKFAFSLPIPPLIPTGKFELHMCCFKEGQLVANGSSELIVEKVGMPEKLSNLAFNHSALYGILAIVAALAAGLVMGLLFGKKDQGGH